MPVRVRQLFPARQTVLHLGTCRETSCGLVGSALARPRVLDLWLARVFVRGQPRRRTQACGLVGIALARPPRGWPPAGPGVCARPVQTANPGVWPGRLRTRPPPRGCPSVGPRLRARPARRRTPACSLVAAHSPAPACLTSGWPRCSRAASPDGEPRRPTRSNPATARMRGSRVHTRSGRAIGSGWPSSHRKPLRVLASDQPACSPLLSPSPQPSHLSTPASHRFPNPAITAGNAAKPPPRTPPPRTP